MSEHICNPSTITKITYGTSSTSWALGLLPDLDLLETEDDIPWIEGGGTDWEHCDQIISCSCGREFEDEEALLTYLQGLVK